MQAITKTITNGSRDGATNFLSMLAGALDTSPVTTSCQGRPTYAFFGLSGPAGSSDEMVRLLGSAGRAIRMDGLNTEPGMLPGNE